ncbi:hypothetical protein PHMEG_0007098 [Phytophthora megakarya]|uniref:Uncharacterized protein n=1 Tax=Phytophthora megakarya TaxID=4795 RepID=A0A225WP64_9STRA|nr:hypothetical protein PHMEG_0007098 [Phytophthora megakarya]
MVQLGSPRERVHQTLSPIMWLQQCLVPVIHDVMLRLLFGDLIVGSRLLFLATCNVNGEKPFRSELEWKLLQFPSNRGVARRWGDDQDYLLLLWRIHTVIVFDATWRLRNGTYFGETQTMSPNIANVQASFRSHYHFLFRHSPDWNIDGEPLNRYDTNAASTPNWLLWC